MANEKEAGKPDDAKAGGREAEAKPKAGAEAPPEGAAPPAAAEGAGEAAAPAAKRARGKRMVPRGVAHVLASFNNTIVTVTDANGETLCWDSAGSVGFKGSRKSTPFAAQKAAERAAEKAMKMGVREVEVKVNGRNATAITTGQYLTPSTDPLYDANKASLARPEVTRFTYDAANRVETHTSPLNVVTRYQYDALGNRIAMIEADGTPQARTWRYVF